jgi:DNA-binding CsgD family transcriptional regulator
VIGAEALVSLGEHARARALLHDHEPALRTWDPTAPGHEVLAVAGLCRLWLGDHEAAEAALTRLVEAGRAAGAASVQALPLAILATLHVRRGDLARAAECAEEAAEIAETGMGGFGFALALAARAMVAGHRGDAATCLPTAERMLALGADLELTSTLAAAEQALGQLHLGTGDAATAAVHLERALAHTHAHGTRDPAFLFTHADLIEALVRSGRADDAAPVLAELEAGAALTGGAWARAAVERCRGLLGPVDEVERRLAAALAAHADPAMPFEVARTRLALGERLRRDRRPAAARAQLAAARDAFAAMGGRSWAARAERELAAAGGDPAPRGTDELTARERDVCDLVAAGATNREVAAALFLSPRTVEHHLRLAYRKLGVRSRSELAARRPGGG